MGVEYERKFRATEDVQAAIAAILTGPQQQFTMETTYYDTADGSLSALRYTLRRRLENDISVCTLKAPAKSGRGEWEVLCPDILQAIPLLIAAGCPEELETLTKSGLFPVCSARFTRTAITVDLEGGRVEVALDRGLLMGGNRQLPLCEVEVELKEGPSSLCDGFARELSSAFALIPEPKSKFARARALCQGE